MNWNDHDLLKVAALRLLLTGQVTRTQSSASLVDELDDLMIVSTTPRRDVFVLVQARLADLERYLSARWPDYGETAGLVQQRGLPITAATLRALQRRHLDAPVGFPQLNRKTWSAWAGAHSKSRERSRPEGIQITIDDTVRTRINVGLRMRGVDERELDLDLVQRNLTEVPFAERSFSENWTLCGTQPRLLLTVENIGAFIDIKKPDDCFLVHCPGWNVQNVLRLRARLPANLPWRHFGDLDPNGIKIGLSLLSAADPGSDARLWIPGAAEAVLSHSRSLSRLWNVGEIPDSLREHPALAWLIERGRWLEQEPVVLLPEFALELARL